MSNSNISGFALKCYVVGDSKRHITIGYFYCDKVDQQNIKDEWNKRVYEKVQPSYQDDSKTQTGYYSHQYSDYQVESPKKPGDKSVLITGRLKTMIERFRADILSRYPNVKLSDRFPEPHIEVGSDIALTWQTLKLGPISLII